MYHEDVYLQPPLEGMNLTTKKNDTHTHWQHTMERNENFFNSSCCTESTEKRKILTHTHAGSTQLEKYVSTLK